MKHDSIFLMLTSIIFAITFQNLFEPGLKSHESSAVFYQVWNSQISSAKCFVSVLDHLYSLPLKSINKDNIISILHAVSSFCHVDFSLDKYFSDIADLQAEMTDIESFPDNQL